MADTAAITTDTSEFQGSIYTDAYGHRIASFRVMDGTSYTDQKYAANFAWCKSAYARGLLDFYIVYFVYRTNGAGALASAWTAKLGPYQQGMVVMIDVESWSGAISGNRSADLNALYGILSGYTGSYNRVLGYANRNDFNNLWPQRDSRMRLILASYGTQWVFRSLPNAIGQQYSDGQPKYGNPSGWPISSAPFGNCDHNGFPDFTPAQLAVLLGVTTASDEEIDMIMIEDAPTTAGGTGGIALIGFADKPLHLGSMVTVNALLQAGVKITSPLAPQDYAAILASSDDVSLGTKLDAILAALSKNTTTTLNISPLTVPISGTATIGTAQ